MAGISIARGQEKKIKLEQLPPAVRKTIAAESANARVVGYSTELEKGKRLYEAELIVDGHSKDISIDGDGNIVEVEEQVKLESLPSSVRDALARAAGSGTIGKVESLTKQGRLVAYEAHVKKGTRRFEIQVGPGGEKLAHPED